MPVDLSFLDPGFHALAAAAQQHNELAEQKRSAMANEALASRHADLADRIQQNAEDEQDFAHRVALSNMGAQETSPPDASPFSAPPAPPPPPVSLPTAAPPAAAAPDLGTSLRDYSGNQTPAPAQPTQGAPASVSSLVDGAGLMNDLGTKAGVPAATLQNPGAGGASAANTGFVVKHGDRYYTLPSPNDLDKAAIGRVAAQHAADHADLLKYDGIVPPDSMVAHFPGLVAGQKVAPDDFKAMDHYMEQESLSKDRESQATQRIAAANAPAKAPKLTDSVHVDDKGNVTHEFFDEQGNLAKTITTPHIGPTKALPAAPPSPLSPAAQAAIANPPAAGQRNEAFRKALPAAEQPLVKGLADGVVAWPSGYAQKDPVVMGRVADTLRYDPSASAQRFALRNSFTGGKDAANVTSLNTVIGHLGTLDTATDTLDNSAFKGYNSFGNWLSRQSGNPQTAPFRTARRAVASELSTALKGGVASEAEVKGWLDEIDASDSPQTLHSTIATVGNLIGSRIKQQEQKYSNGMGQPPPQALTHPDSQAILDRLSRRAGGATYTHTATDAKGNKIGSNDGKTWFDAQTGKPFGGQ